MKLARRLVLLLVVPFLGMIIVLGVLAAWRETRAYQGQVTDDLRITGEALRPAVSEVWVTEGQGAALAVLARSDEHLSVTIRWVALDAEHLSADEIASLTGGNEISRVARSPSGDRAFVYVPVHVDGSARGAIELSEPMDRESDVIRGIVRDRILTTLGTLLASIFVVSFVGQRAISRPIQLLVAQARRIGRGDISETLTLPQKDELGELAFEMNAMCHQIAEARTRADAETQARFDTLTQLQHAERLSTVGKMTTGVAHELGTPLNVISGRAKMIARETGCPDGVVENATIIEGQAKRMTAIIRQLLTFARRGTPKRTRVVLPELARTTLEMLRPLAKKSHVELRLATSEPEGELDADAGQIEQVLTNLVVNGIHAMPEGGELTVSIDEVDAKNSRYVRLQVKDEGTGIPQENLEKIFEPFFTTRDVGVGTGLGLSVAHGIIRDHGGWIAVESVPTKGSTFSVYLPRGAAS